MDVTQVLQRPRNNARAGLSALRDGLVAGFIAGTLVEAYLFATGVAHWPVVYQWIASTVVGKAAFTQPGTVWLGIAMHAAISLGWGVAYAVSTARVPALARRPFAGGTIFGLIVYASMQLVLGATGSFTAPEPLQLLNALIAHVFFFGLPIAFYVAFAQRRRMEAPHVFV